MNSLTVFSLELAQSLYGSTQIIDLDWAWGILGYDKKGNAKRMLTSYFEPNFDFFVQSPVETPESLPHDIFLTCEKNSNAGRPTEKIYLTVECFKEMGMLAKSEQGKQIRKYFLHCETIAKKSVQAIPQLQEQINSLQQQMTQLQSQIQNLLPGHRTDTNPNTPPPGWQQETWNQLPPQDKAHFRFLHRKRGFTPDSRPDTKQQVQELSVAVKHQQQQELQSLLQPLTPEQLSHFQFLKQQASMQTF